MHLSSAKSGNNDKKSPYSFGKSGKSDIQGEEKYAGWASEGAMRRAARPEERRSRSALPEPCDQTSRLGMKGLLQLKGDLPEGTFLLDSANRNGEKEVVNLKLLRKK